MCRKLVLPVLVAALLGFAGSALAISAHQVDDFESYVDTAALRAPLQWQYALTTPGAAIESFLDTGGPNANKVLRVQFTFPDVDSTDAWGVVGFRTFWNWQGQEGIRLWVKGSTSATGTSPQYFHVRFWEGDRNGVGFATGGDSWVSPDQLIDDLDPNGQYIYIPFADFTDYGGRGGDKDNGVLQLNEIHRFYVGTAYTGLAPANSSVTLWVDDIVAITPPDPALAHLASDPRPSDRSACVSRWNTVFEWVPGYGTGEHVIYLGTNPILGIDDQVGYTMGTTSVALQFTLDANLTYYWRVDELNAVSAPGDVWSFTTCNYNDITFYVVTDTHVGRGFWPYWQNQQIIRRMNNLLVLNDTQPRSDQSRGLIVSGDLADEHGYSEIGVASEWKSFINHFGAVIGEGRTQFPVFEGFGNHDYVHIGTEPTTAPGGVVRDGIASRNSRRPVDLNVSTNGLAYSWDWDSVHFVNLNVYPGFDFGNSGSENSLGFLVSDLSDKVGASGRPVIIYFHYPLPIVLPFPLRFIQEGWTETKMNEFAATIAGYNVIAIFTGHWHRAQIHYVWNGIDVYEHGASALGGTRFTRVRISGVNNSMTVATNSATTWTASWEQTAISFPSTVAATFPVAGSIVTEPDTRIITASFSEAMDETTIDETSFLLTSPACGSGEPCTQVFPGKVSYDPGTLTATLTLDEALASSIEYEGIITAAVTNLAGTPLPSDFKWRFEYDGCFIATAAYGSYLDPHVKTLRDFRDGYLLTNTLGRNLVELYNEYSPPAAGFIARHDSMRAITRTALTPVVYGIAYPRTAIVLLLLGLSLGGAGLVLRKRRFSKP